LAKAFVGPGAVTDERLFLSPLTISPAALNKGLDALLFLLSTTGALILFQAQDQRSTVMNGACDLQALNRQVLGCRIVMLACRCLRKQDVDERLALLVSKLLVTLQASFQQETRTWDVTLAQGNLYEMLSSLSQQTLFSLLGQCDQRFFQRSSTILALSPDTLAERRGLASCFACFATDTRAVLGWQATLCTSPHPADEGIHLCFRQAVDARRMGQ
jgi:hypothetical protein